MGGNRFYTRQKGKTMQEAYRDACRLAEQEYGHQQGYSGEINSTGGVVDLTREWKLSKLSYNTFISKKEEGNLTKGNAYGVCIIEPKLSKNKVKTTVEHNVEKGTKKWILSYVVYESGNDNPIKGYSTKGDAVKNARERTEATGRTTYINMEKMLEKGSAQVARISYKPSKDETTGEYIFFGIAPC